MKVIVMSLFFSPRSRSAIFGLTLCLTAGLNSLAMAAPSAAEKAKIDKANDNTFAALTFLSTVCLQENEKNAELPLGKALMGNADFKKWFDRRNLQLARWHYYVYCEKFTNNDKCPITETFQPNSLMNMAAEKVRRHLFISAYMKCYEFKDFAYPFQIVPEKLWNECWKYKSMTYHELLADVMKILRKSLE